MAVFQITYDLHRPHQQYAEVNQGHRDDVSASLAFPVIGMDHLFRMVGRSNPRSANEACRSGRFVVRREATRRLGRFRNVAEGSRLAQQTFILKIGLGFDGSIGQ